MTAADSCGAPPPERVVILTDDSVVRGGAAVLALRQASLLAERGIPVTFVCGDAGTAAELSHPGIDVLAVGARRLRDAPRGQAAVQGLWHRQAGDAVAALIERIDTPGTRYHLHNWQTILSPATLHALRGVASRTWLHAHDYFLCCPNGAFHNYVTHRACDLVPLSGGCVLSDCDKVSRLEKGWRLLRQASLHQAMGQRDGFAGVLLIHDAMREPFLRSGWPGGSLHTLPNPAPAAAAERVPAERNSSWLFVGRLEHGKGVTALLEAAERAGERIEVAGDGELRQSLSKRFPSATFHGWLDREQLAGLRARARFVVVPTLVPEPFGLVLIEALQAGVPVMVSRSAALADDIVAAGAGVVCDANDVATLGQQLRAARTLDDASVRAMSMAAQLLAPRLAVTETEWIDGMLERYAITCLRNAP